ncbi:right-handed parallel beta-helix repeat-containing protein [bacterium]|nr:right-handed parallel beta-helix repeat-containing protein [candidate division CSSED10-310 bacterium]
MTTYHQHANNNKFLLHRLPFIGLFSVACRSNNLELIINGNRCPDQNGGIGRKITASLPNHSVCVITFLFMEAKSFVGRNIREYQILEVIGQGGMAAVLKARHTVLNTIRAIKLIREDWSQNPKFVQRFKREARLLVKLNHPNLVQIFDFFEEQGHLFLVMDFVEGESLASRLERQGRLPEQVIIPIMIQALEGLAEAHMNGIVHRDISPENIMLKTLRDGSERAVIIDFGIAKVIEDQEASGTLKVNLTETGKFLGKLKYCSPEQVEGKPADIRTDLYSAGLILYRGLTGELPFRARSVLDALFMRQHEDAPSLAETANRSFSTQLEATVKKLLARKPDDRYFSAADVIVALRTALQYEPESTDIATARLPDLAEETVAEQEITPPRLKQKDTKPQVSERQSQLGIYLAIGFAVIVIVAAVLALLHFQPDLPSFFITEQPVTAVPVTPQTTPIVFPWMTPTQTHASAAGTETPPATPSGIPTFTAQTSTPVATQTIHSPTPATGPSQIATPPPHDLPVIWTPRPRKSFPPVPVISQQDSRVFIVSASGNAHFTSIKEALEKIPEASRLIIRPGIYNETLVINKPVELIGEGNREDIIITSANGYCLYMQTDLAAVRGVTLQCNAGQTLRKYTVEIPQGHLVLQDCIITSNSLSCIAAYGETAFAELRSCIVRDGAESGLFFYNNSSGRIIDCDIYNHQLTGIIIKSDADPYIYNCHIHNGRQSGVFVYSSGRGTLESCRITGNAYSGIMIKDHGNPALQYCTISTNQQSGIFTYDSGKGIVDRCDIYSNAHSGIRLENNAELTVTGSRIHHNTISGLRIKTEATPVIDGCEIYENRLEGIWVSDNGGGTVRNSSFWGNERGPWRIESSPAFRTENNQLSGK